MTQPPTRHRARRAPAGAAVTPLALFILGVLMATAAGLGWRARPAAEGAALFDGRRALQAHIAGHAEPLPAAASACRNCHGDSATRFGPVLNADALLRPQPRRGGPPTRYDANSLCRLVRSGIDPAWVTLDRAMPRYALSDAQCRALWAHMLER